MPNLSVGSIDPAPLQFWIQGRQPKLTIRTPWDLRRGSPRREGTAQLVASAAKHREPGYICGSETVGFCGNERLTFLLAVLGAHPRFVAFKHLYPAAPPLSNVPNPRHDALHGDGIIEKPAKF